MPRRAAIRPGVADRLLTVAAVLGVVTVVTVLLGAALGVRPVILRSGSMAPAMETGTLAASIRVPADQVRIGDVVSVPTPSGTWVTHRVVNVVQGVAGTELTLRGDANQSLDPTPYRVEEAYRVFAHVPRLGYVVAFAASPWSLAGLGLAVLGLLWWHPAAGGPRGGSHAGPGRARRRRRGPPDRGRPAFAGRAARLTAATLVTPALLLGPASTPAWGVWTDPVDLSGTNFTATTVPAAATFTCGALGVLSVTFNWAAVAGATDYTLHYGSGGASTTTVAGTSATVVTAVSGGTAWVVANHDYGAVTWSSVASQTRTYTVAVVSLCS